MKYVLTIILALTLYFPSFAEDGFKWCLYFSDLNYPIKPEYEAQFDELAEFIKLLAKLLKKHILDNLLILKKDLNSILKRL